MIRGTLGILKRADTKAPLTEEEIDNAMKYDMEIIYPQILKPSFLLEMIELPSEVEAI